MKLILPTENKGLQQVAVNIFKLFNSFTELSLHMTVNKQATGSVHYY